MTNPHSIDDPSGDRPAGLRSAMVDALADQLTDPAWRAAFVAVPRHLLVPAFYRMLD